MATVATRLGKPGVGCALGWCMASLCRGTDERAASRRHNFTRCGRDRAAAHALRPGLDGARWSRCDPGGFASITARLARKIVELGWAGIRRGPARLTCLGRAWRRDPGAAGQPASRRRYSPFARGWRLGRLVGSAGAVFGRGAAQCRFRRAYYPAIDDAIFDFGRNQRRSAVRRRAGQYLVPRRQRSGPDRHRLWPAAARQGRNLCDDGDDRLGQPAAHGAAVGAERHGRERSTLAGCAGPFAAQCVSRGWAWRQRSWHRCRSRHPSAGSSHRARMAAAVPARIGCIRAGSACGTGTVRRPGRHLCDHRRGHRCRRALSSNDRGRSRSYDLRRSRCICGAPCDCARLSDQLLRAGRAL